GHGRVAASAEPQRHVGGRGAWRHGRGHRIGHPGRGRGAGDQGERARVAVGGPGEDHIAGRHAVQGEGSGAGAGSDSEVGGRSPLRIARRDADAAHARGRHGEDGGDVYVLHVDGAATLLLATAGGESETDGQRGKLDRTSHVYPSESRRGGNRTVPPWREGPAASGAGYRTNLAAVDGGALGDERFDLCRREAGFAEHLDAVLAQPRGWTIHRRAGLAPAA